MAVPAQIVAAKYISLTTFKKDGTPIRTPIWFAEENGKLYFMTRNDSWKYKRIRNNPQVMVATCTIRGAVTGPDYSGRARILPKEEWRTRRAALRKKYWLARLPFWSGKNEVLEIELA